MKNLKLLVIVLVCSISFAFKMDINPQHNLKGIWVLEQYGNNGVVYNKHQSFVDDKPGFEFLDDGKLLKRQNAGWCGTPPISYSNFEGTWSLKNDSIVVVNYNYWGGTIQEDWKIINLDEDKLSITILDHTIQRKEY